MTETCSYKKKGNEQLPASKFIAAWHARFPRDSTAFLNAITLEVMTRNPAVADKPARRGVM